MKEWAKNEGRDNGMRKEERRMSEWKEILRDERKEGKEEWMMEVKKWMKKWKKERMTKKIWIKEGTYEGKSETIGKPCN